MMQGHDLYLHYLAIRQFIYRSVEYYNVMLRIDCDTFTLLSCMTITMATLGDIKIPFIILCNTFGYSMVLFATALQIKAITFHSWVSEI